MKRNKSRDNLLLHVNDCVVLQHKHPRDIGVSEDPVASVWFLLTGRAALTGCFQEGKSAVAGKSEMKLIKAYIFIKRQQILHGTQFIIMHPECGIISHREDLVESRDWRKCGPCSVSHHHF